MDTVVGERRGANRATVSVDEAAAMLGIGRGSAFRAVRAGEIPSVRIGRRVLVPLAALERLLNGEEAARQG
jgi:excisionase family DNA binding protein